MTLSAEQQFRYPGCCCDLRVEAGATHPPHHDAHSAAYSPVMDKQLACATFATVIPVLMISGHFAAGWEERLIDRLGRWFFGSLTVGLTLCEVVALVGVEFPGWVTVEVGSFGAIVAASGVGTALLIPVIAAYLDEDAANEDEGTDSDG